MSQWGQFLIVDKPFKIMLKPLNDKTVSEEKGVLRQMVDQGGRP
jgi:hypothetical protein